MAEYKRITLVLPASSKWDAEDLAAKAEKIGMTRNELIIKAIDMLYNFDDDFLKYIKHYSDGLKIPEYMVIQNMIILRMGEEAAQREVHGSLRKSLDEFIHVIDDKGPRTLTGKELYTVVKNSKVEELKRQKEQHDKILEQHK